MPRATQQDVLLDPAGQEVFEVLGLGAVLAGESGAGGGEEGGRGAAQERAAGGCRNSTCRSGRRWGEVAGRARRSTLSRSVGALPES